MTIPWMMNCAHKADSWCIPCVVVLHEQYEAEHVIVKAQDMRIDELAHERVEARKEWQADRRQAHSVKEEVVKLRSQLSRLSSRYCSCGRGLRCFVCEVTG